MARLSFIVQGEGGTPVELPVTLTPLKVFLNGLETESVAVDISNPLSRDVVFTQVAVTVNGTAKDKVNATLRFDNFTVPTSGTYNNFLDVESVEEIFEEETFDISVTAEESTT